MRALIRARTRLRMKLAGDIRPVGDGAVLAVLHETLQPASVAAVWSLEQAIRALLDPSVLDVVPAYGSVLVRFDPVAVDMASVMACVRAALENAPPLSDRAPREIEIAVNFDSQHALDLADVASAVKLQPSEVIEEFCRPTYRVAFLGFSAGFPYLLGLSPKLDVPRLASPRVRVPAGSVAIARGQCGIYPRPTPGGWRILGNTNTPIFDVTRDEAALFRPGDAVRFRALSES